MVLRSKEPDGRGSLDGPEGRVGVWCDDPLLSCVDRIGKCKA